ncbi:uncharacterized protein LOC131071906 [Cryptomeria japonica]|uniref:uncharacterized protein LOC131071906 n=1 Tax=Cryptomeria japonica TaxID=3369 RepID=UPI0027DA9AB7|nr:uncharacterized protein LOC131071906 [Cryptomeria japonica]
MEVAATEEHLIKGRLWKMLRALVFLSKRGSLISRYLHAEVTKKAKLFANNVRNLMFQSRSSDRFGLREYEFSSSDSLAFTNKLTRPRQRNYFSCIRATSFEAEEEYNMRVDILQPCNFPAFEEVDAQTYNMGDGEELGTLVSRSVDVSVDREAEDFIARFYNQIKLQRQISLLQYEEMLVRGASR